MKQQIIDARGLACPEPVVRARKALIESGAAEITVLVDSDASAENVARMARMTGCEVALEERGGHFGVILKRDARAAAAPGDPPAAPACCGAANVAVLFASATVGHGDDDLGRLLTVAFVKTLKSLSPPPKTLLFMNGGVRLAVEGSELVGALAELEAEGAELLVCGTCLDFFRLKEKLRVGKVSNMFEIASRLVAADRVVRP
ncbi:MAG: sulfurtransferase-like selenium metabolism protein YedF [Proteobacteria bacterium]|nr:sulfurtransferase-like selenium metabolism protein YedF [Pseudomonadota bacterium]